MSKNYSSLEKKLSIFALTGLLTLGNIIGLNKYGNAEPHKQVNQYYSGLNLENPRIIEAGIDQWPPYEYFENGPKGLAVEIANLAINEMGKKIAYEVNLPWARALDFLRNNRQHFILSGSKNKERENWIYFGDEDKPLKPITHFIWGAFTYGNNKIREKKGTVRDYFYPEPFKEKYRDLKDNIVNSNESIIKMLEAGRIDIGLMDINNAIYLSKQLKIPIQLDTDTSLYAMPAYVLINPNWKEKDLFVRILNEMFEDGRIKILHNKWGIPFLEDIPSQGAFIHQNPLK